MINSIHGSSVGGPPEVRGTSLGENSASQGPAGSSFADVLKNSVAEVARLQQESSHGVQDLVTGRTDSIVRVLTDAEKASLAFKMLLAIRAKLMDAYNDIKSISV